jgi:hypothetical protein
MSVRSERESVNLFSSRQAQGLTSGYFHTQRAKKKTRGSKKDKKGKEDKDFCFFCNSCAAQAQSLFASPILAFTILILQKNLTSDQKTIGTRPVIVRIAL